MCRTEEGGVSVERGIEGKLETQKSKKRETQKRRNDNSTSYGVTGEGGGGVTNKQPNENWGRWGGAGLEGDGAEEREKRCGYRENMDSD